MTRTVQLLFAATVPFEKEIEAAAATGANVGAPHPVVVAAGGVATTMAPGEVGKASVKLRPLTDPPFGFVSVNVSVETPPTLVGFGAKCLEIVTSDGLMIVAMRAPVAKSLL